MGDEMLAKVCELAFEVAKEGDAPEAMKNYLYLAHRPPRAYSVAQRALEEDDGFRFRVADRATIENVGEAGYLWLHRPEGWERRFAALNSGIEPIDTAASVPSDRPPMPEPPTFAAVDPAPAPTVDSIELELSSLRDLVDRLADERQNVRSSVTELEEELETRRAENLAMSTHLSALRAELSEVQATEDSVAAQRDTALERVAELEARISELETNTTHLETKVGSLTGDVDRLQSELTSANAERDGALAELAEISAERDDAVASLGDERAGSGKEIAELAAAKKKLAEDNTELAARIVVAEQARVDLENQLDDVSGKWQEASLKLAAASEAEEQLTAALAERDRLAAQLADASRQMASIRAAADDSHEQLKAALAEAERVVAPASDEQDELGRTGDVPIDDAATEDAETVTDQSFTADDGEELHESDVEFEAGAEVASGESDASEIEDVDVPEPVEDEPVEVLPAGRTRIDVPSELSDDVDIARHIVSTPDVVLLIDGDGAAGLGWPHLDVGARRSALVNYLGQLTADTGAAADVVFERPVGAEDALPVSRAVRVRIADVPVGDSPLFTAIVDGYPEEWPIAVVSDEPAIVDRAEAMQITHLGNGQLLDLFLFLSSSDS